MVKSEADEWIAAKTGREYKIADCLFQDGDERIANALYDQIINYLGEQDQVKPYIILVDHGTPLREVNYVREAIGTQLAKNCREPSLAFQLLPWKGEMEMNMLSMIPCWRNY